MSVSEVVDRSSLKDYLRGLGRTEEEFVGNRIVAANNLRLLPYAFAEERKNHRNFGEVDIDNFVRLYIAAAATACRIFLPGSNASRVERMAKSRIRASQYGHSQIVEAFKSGLGVYSGDGFSTTERISAASALHKAHLSSPLDAWESVRSDLELYHSYSDNFYVPEKVIFSWRSERQAQRTKPSFEFWICWFDRVLFHQNLYPETLWSILKEFEEDEPWRGSVSEINAKFDPLLELYSANGDGAYNPETNFNLAKQINVLIEAAPQGEDVAFDASNNQFSLIPTDEIDETFLPDLLDQVKEAEEIFDFSTDISNQYLALEPEVEKLTKARVRYSDRPVMLLKRLHSVELRVESKIKNGHCPTAQSDEKIEEFLNTISQVQAELIAFSPEVRKYSEAQSPEIPKSLNPQVVEGAEAIAIDSDEALANAVEDEVAILNDPEASAEEKQGSIKRLLGIVVRSYKAARPTIKETAALIKDVTTIAAATGAGAGSIAWLASPAFRELVRNAIRAMGLGT